MKLVKLKPLTPYFFGYNNTFGKLGSNYFVKSALFPQQSAVFGMIRKEILLQSGLLKRGLKDEWVLKDDYQKAKELVGRGKLYFDERDEKLEFGKIKSISPVFIFSDGKYYFHAPDIEYVKKENGNFAVGFDYKKGVWGRYFSNEDSLSGEDIFKEVEMAFNAKKREKDSFFKKIAYKLSDNVYFAFFIDVDFDLKDSIVTLGADGSMFEMSVEETQDSIDSIDIKIPVKSEEKLFLAIGDCYIPDLNTDFGITNECVYKTIKQYGGRKGHRFYKSKSVFLYEKGSLFVNLKNDLTHISQKIGFNIIKEVK
ncbi:type III-B CRISPR module-associated Cmr3 family protein [Nautilia lithotrophica]